MMNYESFKELVSEQFIYFVKDAGCDIQELKFQKIHKINQIKDAIMLIPANYGVNPNLIPQLYLDDMYAEYMSLDNYVTVFKNFSLSLKDALDSSIKDYKYLDIMRRDNIYIKLINSALNEELIKTVPHRTFLDLTIIYAFIDYQKDSTMSINITYELAKKLDLEEENLYDIAINNITTKVPNIIIDMDEMMNESADVGEFPPTLVKLYVITNEIKFNASSGILLEEIFYKLAEKINSNLYIIPSSIHELIAMSDEGTDVTYLEWLLQETNRTTVDISDRLSDNVYYYNKQTRTISLADTL